ncbi:unnamed protein product (macronuclear) [Paramecium tetraurelia]|uniref:Transmembrane protein n=1 Tax=Paramecium tetraurelia TaxID=5888 RepID=A0CWL3_PARTE|nr:uncharacterized protein GSPATT00001383001 [Paramecium tetraurelia]CAK75180.1 unnamed protein product [Paramecium tetraurelia]|eukprot:XP_001442577.1 hypothetical protein (macronuclear) [Paramecium tetraurelia strain d4-2]
MERREDDVQYFKVDKSNGQQDKIILTLFSIFMNALIGSLFFYFSTHENKYGGDQCKYLRPCAFWFSIYCFFSLFAWIVLNPYAIYYKHDQIFDYANIVEGSIKLVFFIISFIISSHCGQLAVLTATYIIFNVVVFLILCGLTYFIKPKIEE